MMKLCGRVGGESGHRFVRSHGLILAAAAVCLSTLCGPLFGQEVVVVCVHN